MPANGCLRLAAPAKINLFLRITGRLPDGYHTLVSRMQKVGLYDGLLLERVEAGIALSCPDGKSPEGRENLVFRAAELFFVAMEEAGLECGWGVRMTLVKQIPVAAGLGGGSSDAAAALRGLHSLSGAQLSEQNLAALALRLGADVPFFLQQAPAALAQGIGEQLTPVDSLQGYMVLLVYPGFAVSTRRVYQDLDLTSIRRTDTLKNSRNRNDGVCFGNDLEQVTLRRYPVIGELKEAMLQHGAATALMSGSGPTVFGLFTDREQANQALRHAQQMFRDSYLVEPL